MSLLRVALLALALAVPGAAQVRVAILDTVPPGQTRTNAGRVTLSYEVTGTANGVEVQFFRDDGDTTTVAIPDPTAPPPPFQVTLPLLTNVDGRRHDFTAVARDLVTNEVALSKTFSILADDVGPSAPTVTSPTFPHSTPVPTLTLSGSIQDTNGVPEAGGRITVRLLSTGSVIGGGAILPDGRFTAIATLGALPRDVPAELEIRGVDATGNRGDPLVVQVTSVTAAAPTVEASLEPPNGTITRDPGVAIAGSVSGEVEPLTVHVFVNGALSSQLTGLGDGQAFRHTLSLPGEGTHALGVQATFAGERPRASLATPLGTITLDRTP